jgi:hypothetical protein
MAKEGLAEVVQAMSTNGRCAAFGDVVLADEIQALQLMKHGDGRGLARRSVEDGRAGLRYHARPWRVAVVRRAIGIVDGVTHQHLNTREVICNSRGWSDGS